MGVSADVTTFFQTLGADFASWNTGLMKAMQMNPHSIAPSCVDAITLANEKIIEMLDFSQY